MITVTKEWKVVKHGEGENDNEVMITCGDNESDGDDWINFTVTPNDSRQFPVNSKVKVTVEPE